MVGDGRILGANQSKWVLLFTTTVLHRYITYIQHAGMIFEYVPFIGLPSLETIMLHNMLALCNLNSTSMPRVIESPF